MAMRQSEDKIEPDKKFDESEAAVQAKSNEESKAVIEIGSQIEIDATSVTEKAESKGVFEKENQGESEDAIELENKVES